VRQYDWVRGVGPREERPVLAVTGGVDAILEPGSADFGTNEFLALCREIGAEPVLVANPTLGLRPALNWLEYCNGAAATQYGGQRAGHGIPEPYVVRCWQIPDGFGEVSGKAGTLDAAVNAFREQDGAVRLLVAGEGESLPRLGQVVLAPRVGPTRAGGGMTFEDLAAQVDALRQKGRRVAITDWSLAPSPLGPAITAAKLLNLLARRCDSTGVATCAAVETRGIPAAEGWLLSVRPDGVLTLPVGEVLKLFRAHAVRELVGTEVSGSPEASAALDVLAGRAGKRLVVRVVHSGGADAKVRLAFDGGLSGKATVMCLHGADGKVVPSDVPLANAGLSLVLPARSVTVILLDTEGKPDGVLH
jgi:hypothetical protein